MLNFIPKVIVSICLHGNFIKEIRAVNLFAIITLKDSRTGRNM